MDTKQYEEIFRRLHPRRVRYSRAPRLELRDLWPADQEKFKREIDAVRAYLREDKR
jgi:hypothetical protein